ncbi:MAG: hypothetical protein D3909_07370 [Candidatus Electrothrix sp. ATG1]|nr:hypothetical protein [Candidatus Electrothrix sp. ATG1]
MTLVEILRAVRKKVKEKNDCGQVVVIVRAAMRPVFRQQYFFKREMIRLERIRCNVITAFGFF